MAWSTALFVVIPCIVISIDMSLAAPAHNDRIGRYIETMQELNSPAVGDNMEDVIGYVRRSSATSQYDKPPTSSRLDQPINPYSLSDTNRLLTTHGSQIIDDLPELLNYIRKLQGLKSHDKMTALKRQPPEGFHAVRGKRSVSRV